MIICNIRTVTNVILAQNSLLLRNETRKYVYYLSSFQQEWTKSHYLFRFVFVYCMEQLPTLISNLISHSTGDNIDKINNNKHSAYVHFN